MKWFNLFVPQKRELFNSLCMQSVTNLRMLFFLLLRCMLSSVYIPIFICYSYAYCSINEWYNGCFMCVYSVTIVLSIVCMNCTRFTKRKTATNDCAMPLVTMRVMPQNKTVLCFFSLYFFLSFCIELHCGCNSNFWNGRVKLTCGC